MIQLGESNWTKLAPFRGPHLEFKRMSGLADGRRRRRLVYSIRVVGVNNCRQVSWPPYLAGSKLTGWNGAPFWARIETELGEANRS